MFQAAWCGGRRWRVAILLVGMAVGRMLGQVAGAPKELTPEQSALMDKAIANEAKLLAELKTHSPLVEVYGQNLKADAATKGFVPEKDQYGLYRVDFDRVAKGTETRVSKEALAFFRMLVVDLKSFDRESYTFEFMHNDMLGGMACAAFNVRPIKTEPGRFAGRIFIERRGGTIVRLMGQEGDYAIDSRRKNVDRDVWLPSWVYVERLHTAGASPTQKLASTVRVWGYQTQRATGASVDGVLDEAFLKRLSEAGLIDAASDIDAKLSAIANDVLQKNGAGLAGAVQVRVLLGEPLATMSFGRTILISRGLLDTTLMTGDAELQRGIWRAALAFPLAQILLEQRVEGVVSDRMLYPEGTAFETSPLRHSDRDNDAAAKKAMQLLDLADFKVGQDEYGVYLHELELRASGLKALSAPLFGDGLLKRDGRAWMGALVGQAAKLSEAERSQVHVNTLGVGLKIDPWNDTVREALLGGKAPDAAGFAFDVVPLFEWPAYFQPASPAGVVK